MSLQRPSRTHSCPYSFRLRVYAIRLWPTWRTASSNAHYFWISHFDISRSAPRISLRWLVLAFLNITGMRPNPNRKCLWFGPALVRPLLLGAFFNGYRELPGDFGVEPCRSV